MKNNFLTLTGMILFLAVTTNAQITPAEAVAQMGRGINLGNTLEPPTEGGWNNPKAEEYLFDDYVEAGFKTVRIPITWDMHVDQASPYTVQESWLDRVEQVLDWGLSRDMFVIINAHHEDWLKETFDSQVSRDRFDSIWSQVSVRFKGKSEKLFFEMLNEPRTHEHDGLTQTQIDEMNTRVLGIIRKDHPTRIVVYSGKGWSSSSDMMAAAVPDDPNIMAYYHSYDPWNFAGEGIGTWGSTSQRNALYSKFSEIRSWADANGLEILLGEFGSVEECDYNSRMIHYASYVRGCLENNIASTVWDDGGWFEVLHRNNHTWEDSKDILIHTTLMSPDNISLTAMYDTAIMVQWTPALEAYDTLVVERRDNVGEFSPIGGVSPGMTSYIDALVEMENTYYYRVIASHDTTESYSYPVMHYLERAFPTVKMPFTGIHYTLPGTIEAEDYDYGGEGVSYRETTEKNITEEYRPYEGVDIELGSGGAFMVGSIDRGEWIEYSVDVAEAGPYRITTQYAAPDGGAIFRFSFDGIVASTVTVPETGSWDISKELNVHVNLEQGEQVMRISALKLPPFNLDKFTFTSAVGLVKDEVESFSLYPNPAEDRVFIQSDQLFPIEAARFFSAEGVLVKHMDEVDPENGLDVSDLTPGLYLLQLEGEHGTLNNRFLKAF